MYIVFIPILVRGGSNPWDPSSCMMQAWRSVQGHLLLHRESETSEGYQGDPDTHAHAHTRAHTHTHTHKIEMSHTKLESSKKDPTCHNPDRVGGENAGEGSQTLYPTTTPGFLTSQPGSSAGGPQTARVRGLVAPRDGPGAAILPAGRHPGFRPQRAFRLAGPGRSGVRRRTRAGGRGAGPEHVTAAPALRPPSPPPAAPGVPRTLGCPPPAPPSSRPSATEPEPRAAAAAAAAASAAGTMASGVTVNDEVIKVFNDMKGSGKCTVKKQDDLC
ncbi:cofilin-2 isoform X2 [Peromyscus californicus insignis]|nr:cofilin-2 isoform X2 [Peromyscus californicus insignis]